MLDQNVTLRPVTDLAEMVDVYNVQVAIWGKSGATPVNQFLISIKTGGVVLAAFLGGKVVGFAYGFPAYDGKQIWLASHMLAVAREARNRGIGTALKWAQRDWALTYGYRRMTWTFDPLEAKNAYVNLNRLGAFADTYLVDCYGVMDDELNRGLPSDRLVADWDLLDPHVVALATGGASVRQARAVMRIPVPVDAQTQRAQDPGWVLSQRLVVREQMMAALAAGYRAEGFDRAQSCYLLHRHAN